MEFDDLNKIVELSDGENTAILVAEDAHNMIFPLKLTCNCYIYVEGEAVETSYDNFYLLTHDASLLEDVKYKFSAANADYAVNGETASADIFAYYPMIGLKKIDDSVPLYLGTMKAD